MGRGRRAQRGGQISASAVIPLAQIRARGDDPATLAGAAARMARINARLAPKQSQLEALAAAAIRARRREAKVTLLREMLDILSAAASGIAACGKGCSACCHQSVVIAADEAAVIGREIGVAPRVPAHYGEPGQTERAAREHYGEACPFLDNGECGIYASRPLACRTLFNLDADALLCTVVPGDAPKVPYLDYMPFTMVIAKAFIHSMNAHADLREFFPNGRRRK